VVGFGLWLAASAALLRLAS